MLSILPGVMDRKRRWKNLHGYLRCARDCLVLYSLDLISEAAWIIAPARERIYSWAGCRPGCRSLTPGQSITCYLLSLLAFSNPHLVFRSWGKTPGLLLLYILLRVLLALGTQYTFANWFLCPGPCSNFCRRNIFQSRSLCKTDSDVLALCSVYSLNE